MQENLELKGAISTSSAANSFANSGHVTGNNYWSYTLTSAFNVIDNLIDKGRVPLGLGIGYTTQLGHYAE